MKYIDNGDGTVTDTTTSLMWQQEDTRMMNWHDAMDECKHLSLAGHDDWRLPTDQELLSIVEHDRAGPACDPVFKFGSLLLLWHWSSTPYSKNSDVMWGVGFKHGFPGLDMKSYKHPVRAVRTVVSKENKLTQTITSCRNCLCKEDDDVAMWCGAAKGAFYLGEIHSCDEMLIPDNCPLLKIKPDKRTE